LPDAACNFDTDGKRVGDPTLSRMTIVTNGTERVVEQIIKQLNKLVSVAKLTDLTEVPFIGLVDIFRGKILDVTDASYVVELTGDDEKLRAFLGTVGADNVIEVARSGATGIARGDKSLKV